MKREIQSVLIVVILFLIPNINFGQPSCFVLFTAAGAFSNDGTTVVTGDVGTGAGAFNTFPPGVLVGDIHVADAATVQAAIDVNNQYASLQGMACGLVLGTSLVNGQLLTPNTYCLGAASTLDGSLTLDGEGDPNASFISDRWRFSDQHALYYYTD